MAAVSDPPLACRAVETPIGTLTIVASARGVREVRWGASATDGGGNSVSDGAANEHLERAIDQIGEYFRGERRRFDVPLEIEGREFQRRVWSALARIPFGETRSYGAIAEEIGRPAAARAVGAATGRNPVPILVPCHRVIGANGALTGFAGGIEAKRALLAHEGAAADPESSGRLPGF